MARIRPARHYQRKDSPIRLIADYGKRGIRRDMHGALKHLSDMVPTGRAVDLARSGLWNTLKDEIAWGHFKEILKAPFGRIGKVFEAGAALGVNKINGSFAQRRKPVRFAKAIGDRFNFDVYTDPTQSIIRAEQDRIIGDLTAQARDAIDAAIMFGAKNGLSSEEIVQDIRNVIGLSEQLANAAMNYEAALRNLDVAALQRQLRNAEMDTAVQDAMDSGIVLSEDQIQSLTNNYIDNALDYRAAMIAQTESTRAASLGLQDAYQQAVDRGAVPEEAITRNWQVALDERTCEICLSIPDMNPDGVGLNDDFDSIDGPISNPPDPHPNAVFAGSTFVSYGGLQRMVAAEYKGPAIRLTAGKHGTTIGPNHPMLTARGMVPAKLINVGDKLVCDTRTVQLARLFNSDSNFHEVPVIEDAFSALKAIAGYARIPAPRNDLHGDVVFCKEEVEVVFPQRKLLLELNSFGLEGLRDNGLMGADVKLHSETTFGSALHDCDRILLPSPGGIGGCDVGHFVLLEVTAIDIGCFKGWAFDASTDSSLYCSDGFVVSNCRCSVEFITNLDMVPNDAFAE